MDSGWAQYALSSTIDITISLSFDGSLWHFVIVSKTCKEAWAIVWCCLILNHIGAYTCITYSTDSIKFFGGFSVEVYNRSALDAVVNYLECTISPGFWNANSNLHAPVDSALHISNKYLWSENKLAEIFLSMSIASAEIASRSTNWRFSKFVWQSSVPISPVNWGGPLVFPSNWISKWRSGS